MAFFVGPAAGSRQGPLEHKMTCKVRREGVALYRVISPQLDASWLRKTYERDLSQLVQPDLPAFLVVMVPGNVGLAPRVYSVQVFPR